MKSTFTLLTALLLAPLAALHAVEAAAATPARAQDTPVLEQLAAHNVVWDSPSQDMHGSMPIGNGDLAANFWVEPSGDLVFYLSKSDSWDADQELLKLGRVRIRLDKPFVRDGRPFRQELDLARGCIVVESGAGDDKTTVDFWIDSNRPVVNMEIKGAAAFTAQVSLETWRDDTILPAEGNAIRWYHRNATSIFPESLKNQHLGHAVEKFHDPLLNLTFGGLIAGEGLVTKDDKTLVTAAPVKSLGVRIHALTGSVGYETCLARSADLLKWEKLGKILSFPPKGWDRWQRAGYLALCDTTWGGSNELETYDGKYWMSFLGGALQGYETDPLAIGLAWTKTPTEAREWTPITKNPVLTRDQPDVRDFEKHDGVVYHFYNAVGDQDRGIALAASKDLRD